MVRESSSASGLLALLVVGLTLTGTVGYLAAIGPGPGRPDSIRAGTATPQSDATAQVTSPEGTPTTARTAPTETATTSDEQNATAVTRETYLVGEGPTETRVTVVDGPRPGPTVVVVGGVHGNEPAGYLAARRVEHWDVERGTLVVVPNANPRAIENGTRKVDGRDLNAQFPVGKRPTSAQARVVWGVIERHDADVVVDLHSSTGIYGVDGGVGQAVFPTVTGPAVEYADATIARVNERYGLTGNESFRRGNVMGRSGTTLARKVAGDENETAYIVETTKRDTDRETRVTWTTAVTLELLRLHGLDPDATEAREERAVRPPQ